jgi:acyl dehydratase
MALTFESVTLGSQLPVFTRHVDHDVINRFAVASFDYNPIHIDPAWKAKADLPGGTSNIAHGQMTMAFMASAITDWACASGGWLTRLDAKYIKPVMPGDDISAGGTVTEKHYHGPSRNYVVVEICAQNQNKEMVAAGKAEVTLP